MFCFEFSTATGSLRSICLQGLLAWQIHHSLQDVLGTQVFAKQFNEVFLLFHFQYWQGQGTVVPVLKLLS